MTCAHSSAPNTVDLGRSGMLQTYWTVNIIATAWKQDLMMWRHAGYVRRAFWPLDHHPATTAGHGDMKQLGGIRITAYQ